MHSTSQTSLDEKPIPAPGSRMPPLHTLTVSAKEQITLRRELLLQHLNTQPRQQVTVEKLANGVLALHAKAPQRLDGFVGCLPPPSKLMSIDKMNTVAAES